MHRTEKKLSPTTVAFKAFMIEKAEALISQYDSTD
jgi:hypothetical protein